jgi:cyclic pyranopterin phosphate synthase
VKDPAGRTIDYLRLSVTDRCNLRCIYCMPDEGVTLVGHDDILRFEEVLRLAGIFRRLGIEKVRVTGGEPLLRRDLPELVAGLSGHGFEELALTTNGILLAPVAGILAGAGLDRVNISLDSLRNEVLSAVTRGAVTREVVEEAVAASLASGLAPVRINCVVLRGLNDGEVPDFVLWAADTGACVRFIEHMPASLSGDMFLPSAEVLRRASVLGTVMPLAGEPGEVQESWGIEGTDLSFGTISPVSGAAFCAGCRRLRLSASGTLISCLSRAEGIDLRSALRSPGTGDDELAAMIGRAVAEKPLHHDGCTGMNMWRTGG